MKKGFITVAMLCMFIILGSSVANAAIIGTSGVAVLIAAPASVVTGALQSDTLVRTFNEKQNIVLASPLAVDITSPGTYDGTGPLTPGTIAAGTTVSSHYLHYDPANDTPTSGIGTSNGTVIFDHQIIGVIVLSTNLDNSDSALGAAGTTYPFGDANRGLEMVGFEGDSITVGCDTLKINSLFVQGAIDQFRVITGTQTCTPTGGFEGCAPSVWKKSDALSYWTGYTASNQFNKVFKVKSSDALTLRQALGKGQGDERAFQRQAVAALLNATSSIVNYAYTKAQVISIVQKTYATKNFNGARIDLASQNNLGCMLDNLP